MSCTLMDKWIENWIGKSLSQYNIIEQKEEIWIFNLVYNSTLIKNISRVVSTKLSSFLKS